MEQQDSFALYHVLIRRCVILNIAVKSIDPLHQRSAKIKHL